MVSVLKELRAFIFWDVTLRNLARVLKDLCAITFCNVAMWNVVSVSMEISAFIFKGCGVQLKSSTYNPVL
jgi:hypothetical protein